MMELTHQRSNFIMRGWRGEASLAVAFWGYGVLGYIIYSIITYGASIAWMIWFKSSSSATSETGSAYVIKYMEGAFTQVLPVLLLVDAIFKLYIIVTIWRSARHAHAFWKFLARLVVVILTLLTIATLLFGATLYFGADFSQVQ